MLLIFLLGFSAILFKIFVTSLRKELHKNTSLFYVNSFFYKKFETMTYGETQGQALLFSSQFLLFILSSLFTFFSIYYLIYHFTEFTLLLNLILFFSLSFFLIEWLPRWISETSDEKILNKIFPLIALLLILTFPFCFIFYLLSKPLLFFLNQQSQNASSETAKQELVQIINESNLTSSLLAHEKKLMTSVLSFQDRVAKEVMVPRVDLFALPSQTSIVEAAKKICEEGYSRIPIFKESVDNITGIVMYKDILEKYVGYEASGGKEHLLEAPIESIQKKAFYIPETKKLSILLQDFLKNRVHFAVIVDEYGGTEGIITIEDILEEIVGEITDEYDEDERLVIKRPDGSYILDGRMTILDLEEELDIEIPSDGDYDTVAGFLFHRAGAIPEKGFIVHHTTFEMEVLSRDERNVKKVLIKKISST